LRDFYEHNSFDATDVPAMVASQHCLFIGGKSRSGKDFEPAHRDSRSRAYAKNRRTVIAPLVDKRSIRIFCA
jgi:hypothetical protein